MGSTLGVLCAYRYSPLLVPKSFKPISVYLHASNKKKANSVAFSPQAKYTDQEQQLFGEVSSNFCGYRMSLDHRNGSQRPLISVF
jgi:hypothetical protein